MAFVLWLLMALVPFGLGKGALRILYGNQPTQETSTADAVLTGTMMIIGLAEAVHLAGCLLGQSFSRCVILFASLLGVCLLLSGFLLLLDKKCLKSTPALQKKAEQARVKRALAAGMTGRQQMIYAIFGIIIILQLVQVVMNQKLYLDGDMTRETVNSFLAEDAVYRVNPMTGQAYTLGMPLRLKILCLPTLYGILCRSFGLTVDTVVLSVVPAFVLILSYLAYTTVAERLFGEQRTGKAVFLVLVALLYSMGDYMPGMDGFGVLYSGFRGTTIRAAILIPYTFGLMLRKKYKLVVLCILAEACMVWTLYGLGVCAAVATGMLFLQLVWNWYQVKQGGKEADLC